MTKRYRLFVALVLQTALPAWAKSEVEATQFLKFRDGASLERFLSAHPEAQRLHPKLLWAETNASVHLNGDAANDDEWGVVVREENQIYPVVPGDESDFVSEPAGDLWGIQKIRAADAWEVTTGNPKIVVAVVDTGVDYRHQALRENMWINEAERSGQAGKDDDGNGYVDDIFGYDMIHNRSSPLDDSGHGSHVAGTVAGSFPGTGFFGVAPTVRIMALKTHDKDNGGTEKAVVKAILYAADMGARILNCSWGGPPEASQKSQLLYDAIEYANKKGAVLVAAAGNKMNDNDANPHYPSSYDLPNIIAVAASNVKDKAAVFSSYGKTSVDIAAPGRDVLSVKIPDGYQLMSGTSMAAPHVSGALALLASTREGRSMAPQMLIETILSQSVKLPVWEPLVRSSGRLDIGFLKNGYSKSE